MPLSLANAVVSVDADIGPLQAKLARGRDALGRFTKDANALGKGALAGGAGGGMFAGLGDKLAEPFDAVTDAVGGLWKNSAMLAGGALAGGIGASVKQAISLESSFVAIQKAAGLPADQFDEVQVGLKAMATDANLAGVSLDDLLKIATVGAKLGIAEKGGPEALLEYSRSMAMVSIAMDDIPVEQVAESMGQVLGVFGEGTDKVLGFGSVVDKLADSTTASAAGIFDVTQRLSGLAAPLGLTIPETAALATAVLDMGDRAEMAGSNLQRIMGTMATAPGPFAKMAGLSEQAFKGLIENNPMGALQAALQGISQLQGVGRLEALQQLGVDGVLGQQVLLGLTQKVQALNPLVGEANTQWVTHAQALESVAMNSATTAAQMTLLMNQIQLTASELGEAFLPALKAIGPVMAEAGKSLATTFAENKAEITSFISDAVGAFGTLIGLLGQAKTAWQGLAGVALATSPAALISKAVGKEITPDMLGQAALKSASPLGVLGQGAEAYGKQAAAARRILSPLDLIGQAIGAARGKPPAPEAIEGTGESAGFAPAVPRRMTAAEAQTKAYTEAARARAIASAEAEKKTASRLAESGLTAQEDKIAARRKELQAKGEKPRSVLDIAPKTALDEMKRAAAEGGIDPASLGRRGGPAAPAEGPAVVDRRAMMEQAGRFLDPASFAKDLQSSILKGGANTGEQQLAEQRKGNTHLERIAGALSDRGPRPAVLA